MLSRRDLSREVRPRGDAHRALTAGRAPWDCRLCRPLRRSGPPLRGSHFGATRERIISWGNTVALVADHQATDRGPSRKPRRGWVGDPVRFDCYALAACTATRAAQSAAAPMTQETSGMSG